MKNLQLIPNIHWKFRYCSGGKLRRHRLGRTARVLTTKDPHHIVFKINKRALKMGLRSPRNFSLINRLIDKYSKRFFVKIEQLAIEKDHVHMLVRAKRRASYQSFFKVVAGQFAQIVTGTHTTPHEGERIWKYRPFSRVVKGYKNYLKAESYVKLNELEATGQRPYSKTRLRGLTEQEIEELWV